MDRADAERLLWQRFGISHFYDEQWEAINNILNGNRILMIQRTGFGKSLCYQFPATVFPGVTVIFSPLIALMRDQVNSLRLRGIQAGYINSEQSVEENRATLSDALDGKLKILYIAPERQENDEWIEATRRLNLSMVVIDEAHTISTWGHDFRPAFRRIIDLVKLLPENLPVLATTATATLKVQQDIEKQIGGRLTTLRGSLFRENLNLYVIRVKSEDEKMLWLAQNFHRIPGTGLIYTGTRVATENYARWLQYVNINAVDYNAGLDAESRKEIEDGLMNNRWKAIVTTNALGMGIDKADIRFIIHTQIPVSPIHYYQEIGRAGRDGQASVVILFFNESVQNDSEPEDMKLPLSFVEGARPGISKYLKVIDLLKEEALSEREITIKANLKSNQTRVIKADLIEQGIIQEVKYDGRKKFEMRFDAPNLDSSKFESIRKSKLFDLQKMVEYVYFEDSRMKYLCNFLDSDSDAEFHNCDNTGLTKLKYHPDTSLEEKFNDFQLSYFPILPLAETISKQLTVESGEKVKLSLSIHRYGEITISINNNRSYNYIGKIVASDFSPSEYEALKDLYSVFIEKKSRMLDGVAGAYYGVSNVGSVIHRCKYDNGGDFPDFLLNQTLRAFSKYYCGIKFDLVLYVPPTSSGDLVKNFAIRFADIIGVPISHSLVKIRGTREQKVFQNGYGKRANVEDAFGFSEPEILKDKKILLLDDIFDSGATLKEIGKMLSGYGVKIIAPIVIAKTVGSTEP